MNKAVTMACMASLLVAIAHGQAYPGQMDLFKIPGPVPHYQEEYLNDTTLDAAAWTGQSKGMHVSFASTDQLFFRSEVPQVQESLSWEGAGWKGERLNIQLLVWGTDTLRQVRFVPHGLKNKTGASITANNFTLSKVAFVVGNYPYGAKDATCGESPHKYVYLMPDRFVPLVPGDDRFEVPGKTLRPVWISIDIPRDARAGTYTGAIDVHAENYMLTLHLKLRVQNQLLPSPHEWKHRLDLWQNPWAVAWENHVQPWSQEHKLLLKKHLRLYADAGGTFITTYAVHSPWADNSYMIEGGMIDWIKRSDGSWKFDYKIFDEYVELAMSVGIDKAITIYTPVPWGFRFRYTDEKTGNYVYESWPPDSKQFRDAWNVFLTDLKKHLQEKKWFSKTYLGINENEMEQTLAAIRVIKAHSRDWKITYAGNWHPQLDSLLDDYCFLFGNETSVDTVKQRTASGRTTTYYVCCNPPMPNNFIFSPPIEGRWQGWYTAAHGYSGFLRWAYDAWPADPLRDARHVFWPSGDCYLVYPGGNSCIRFEKLREGIVDYEKIRILRQQAAISSSSQAKKLLQELDQHLQVFLREKDFETAKITADVSKGRQIMEQLSDALAK